MLDGDILSALFKRNRCTIFLGLKSVFLSRGVCMDGGVYDPDRRGKWLRKLPVAHRELAERLARQLDELVPLRDDAAEWLLKESKSHPIIRKLNTAPGMGAIRSAIVVSVVADPHRFRTSRQFWSYCGLAVVTHSSADWTKDRHGRLVRAENTCTRGLTRKRNGSLKAVFKGAATTVIAQLPEHPLNLNYQRMLTAGIKPNLAKLTLARQIAAIVLSMWKHGEAYDPERQKRAVTDRHRRAVDRSEADLVRAGRCASRKVRGRASTDQLVPWTRRGGPIRRLCALGVPT